MAIKKVEELAGEKARIDLTGPEGNVFVLLGYVKTFGRQLEMSSERIAEIQTEMTSGDYENAVEVFDREFGEYVDLYR